MNSVITIENLYFQSMSGEVTIPILNDVVQYLARSPGISGKVLAKLLDVKRSALSSAILLLTGMTLNDMLKEWKLLHAMFLLRNTTLSYDDVAHLCGFSGNCTLSRFMERMLKCTAYEYREGKSNGHRGAT